MKPETSGGIRPIFRALAVPVAAVAWIPVVNLGPSILDRVAQPDRKLATYVALAGVVVCAYFALVFSLTAIRGRVPRWLGGRG